MRTLLPALLCLTACAATNQDAAMHPQAHEAAVSKNSAPDPYAVADKFRVFHLKYANAHEMASVVQRVFPTPTTCEGQVVIAGVNVVADDRTNSLVVSADALGAELFPRIEDLIRQLDVEVKPSH